MGFVVSLMVKAEAAKNSYPGGVAIVEFSKKFFGSLTADFVILPWRECEGTMAQIPFFLLPKVCQQTFLIPSAHHL